MFKKGLAYQKDGFVNWDPVDKTVLANEQVDSEGRSWRSGAKVERIRLKQWYLKITDYGEKLYKDLDTLDGWPDSVKELQKGWIGLSNGHIVSFKAANKEGKVLSDHLECFTSKLHTLPAVRFVAISPFHPLVQSILDSSDEIMKKQIESIRKKVQSKRETALKEVDELPDSVLVGKCIHPLTHKEVPLYISEYVLDDYGTGAVMGVPAGDERDKKLATAENISYEEGEHEGHIPKDTWGVPSQGLSLRDWLVSRQRYWGVPIPIIHCQSCGSVPVPEKDLPVLLPSVNEGHNWSSKGGARPLDNDTFKQCTCPQCGKAATRDIDTMDTFVDSSWYFLRFLDPHNSKQIFDKKVTDYMPIKAYIGGMEHAIKHLLYARFVHKFLYDLGFVSCNEPFENIITQGLVKGTSYRLKSTGKYITKAEASSYSEDELIVDVEKMSKSKFNGISPLEAIDLHGIDCLKLAMIFAGPVEKDITIDEKLINTMGNFLDRVEKFIEELDIKSLPEQSLLDLKKVQRDYDAGFNYKKIALHVCVARLIEMLNLFKKEPSKIGVQDLKQLLVNLYPFSATFAEEIWNQIQDKRGIPNGKRVLLSSSTLTSLGVGIQASGAASTFKILINSKPVSETIPSSLIINGQIADKELKDFLSNHSNLPKAELVTRVIVNTEKSLINILAPQHKPSPKK